MQLLKRLETLTVVSKSGISRNRKQGLFYCPKCKESVERPLDNGMRTETCGRKGCRKTTQPTHNKSGERLYRTWANLKSRCDDPNNTAYQYYGGKGITYPDHWSTFEGFFMDMGMTYSDGMTIDRIKHDENYSKTNCQWIPLEKNCAKEKQKPVAKYTLFGEFLCSYLSVREAADAEGCSNTSCISRVARGEREQYKGFTWKYL